jgi:uncharacterized protein (TIGR01244 family)
MNVYKLTETLAVAGQITPEMVPQIAEAGYRVLINNRPDGEEPGQPGSAEIAAVDAAAGLEYHHFPVTAMNFPGPDIDQIADFFDDEQRPVFAFCRTGTRCTNLWVISRTAEEQAEAVRRASGIGFDLSMAARILQGQ